MENVINMTILEREKNREKQRRWRLNNLEKSREMKRLSNLRARGVDVRDAREKFVLPRKEKPPIPTLLCLCGRKFLPKLYCIFCK